METLGPARPVRLTRWPSDWPRPTKVMVIPVNNSTS